MNPSIELDRTDRYLLQHLQDAFPLDRRPWKAIGERIGIPEEEALSRAQRLAGEGVVRSIGTVVDAHRVGLNASTLVALRVPESRLVEVARIIGEHPGVSHCYERDHAFNLWFTLSMPDEQSMARELRRLLVRSRIPPAEMLNLPVLRRFKVDVRHRFVGLEEEGGRA